MIRISRKMQLALEAVVDIAFYAGTDPIQSKEITRRQGVPQRYLEQVMQQLVHSGILKGVRGPRGGYRLARERRRISAGEIIRIVAEIESSEDPDTESLSPLGVKVIRPVLEEAMNELLRKLDSITIDELCARARTEGLTGESLKKSDFVL